MHTSPWLVALARGVVAAAAMAAIGYATGWLGGPNVPPGLIVYIPLILAGLRLIEGLVDQIDPKKPS